jgi:tetratricopeptide (TPR) repeat protein
VRRVALIVLLASASAVAAPTEAERLYTAGQKAYDDKRYDEAVAAWERSYSLSHVPALLFNLGQAYRLRAQPGDCSKATDAYQRFLALDKASPQRPKAEGFIAELKPCVAAEDRGSEPAKQEPPPPPVKQEPPPVKPQEPPPVVHVDQPGHGKRLASYIAGGIGLGLAGTGIYFGARARSLGNEVSDACRNGCDWDTVADKDAEGRSAARKQWVFLGLGGVGLATAGVLYWLDGREHAPRVALTPRHDGAVVTWQRSW